jgi:aspartyl/asparaginyl beta-hydroxylase (cupin superfamily)
MGNMTLRQMGEAGQRARKQAVLAGHRVLSVFESWLLQYSLVPPTPFLDPYTFEWVRTVEAGWKDMRDELEKILVYREELPDFEDILRDVAPISQQGTWKTFFFCAYGYRSEENCARCPRTADLLDQVPGLVTAFFSVLLPGTRLPPHRGPYRGVLRYHLGLIVPEPKEACAIVVGGEERHWQEGASLLFDDGYEHTAWNDTDQPRTVLFADILRPLRSPGAQANQAMIKAIAHSPFLWDGRRRHENWQRRFSRLVA